jgi:Protein of unknown function (DUF3107)
VEVKIGLQSAPREIVLETTSSAQDVEDTLRTALADGGLLVLADDKGGTVLVPTDKIVFVEVGRAEQRHIGFSSP